MIRLIPLSIHATGADVTWKLLQERPETAYISHTGNTSRADHNTYISSMPYRAWEIIETEDGVPVGAVYLTNRNEVGIAILKDHQRKGYASQAVKAITERYAPLSAIPGARPGYYVANVAPSNTPSQKLFDGLGAKLHQLTYRL